MRIGIEKGVMALEEVERQPYHSTDVLNVKRREWMKQGKLIKSKEIRDEPPRTRRTPREFIPKALSSGDANG